MPETITADRPPVVVFAFNRPKKLRRVLAALQGQGLDRLLVYVDGPRGEADLRGVQACQELARSVRWAETELHFSQENRGSWTQAHLVNQILQRYPCAIFLEDDCLPVPGFYEFMRQALEHYKDDERVFSIGGYQNLPPWFFRNYPYSLISGVRFIGWGWATWSKRWQEAWPYFEDYQKLFDNLTHIPEVTGWDVPIAVRAMVAGLTEQNWDMRLVLATLWLKKVHLLPVDGLVRNIGVDISGVHGSLSNRLRALALFNRNLARRAPEKIAWLEDVSPDCEFVAGTRDFFTKAQAFSIRRQAEYGKLIFRRSVWPRREVHENLAFSDPQKQNKRALLAYDLQPCFFSTDDPRIVKHPNIWQAHALVQVLNRLGYLVDLIDFRSQIMPPHRVYELFIGQGGANFERISRLLPPAAPRIYFATRSYWRYHNQQEESRFADLERRRGVRLPYNRQFSLGEEHSLRLADGILGLGNAATCQTYVDFERVKLLNGATLYDDYLDWCPKEFNASRQHFLFYSGPGNVHKGLDLLLEAFSGLQQHLWICTRLDARFSHLFSRELNQLDNIHQLGWMQPRSRAYYQMMRRCAFYILPSCSEGQSYSALEAMNQGLIPLVSPQAGLDVADFGAILEPVTVEAIQELVKSMSALPPTRCQDLSSKARQAAQTVYSPEAFLFNLQRALEELLG